MIRCMGTGSRFVRLKLGIGKPLGKDLAKYVLRGFTPEEEPLIAKAVARAKDCVIYFVNEGLEKTMNKFNQSEESVAAQEKLQEEKLRQREREKKKEERKKLWEAQQALLAKEREEEQRGQEGQQVNARVVDGVEIISKETAGEAKEGKKAEKRKESTGKKEKEKMKKSKREKRKESALKKDNTQNGTEASEAKQKVASMTT